MAWLSVRPGQMVSAIFFFEISVPFWQTRWVSSSSAFLDWRIRGFCA
ncbi:hypothetical protein ELI_1194 [Eubacterium callanderi]|uniref:Uncharacterized protein n=1 Tax=Eubacterium callanderi TaxID=53442 RepID=E3GKU0_9FIRM|nr:hypothetical protein ELI_1194 [Eubacterium callanderi]